MMLRSRTLPEVPFDFPRRPEDAPGPVDQPPQGSAQIPNMLGRPLFSNNGVQTSPLRNDDFYYDMRSPNDGFTHNMRLQSMGDMAHNMSKNSAQNMRPSAATATQTNAYLAATNPFMHTRSLSPYTCPVPTAQMQPYRMRKQPKEPEKYNGKTNLDDYLTKFEEISHWNEWSLEEKGLQLGMSLTGSAMKAHIAMPDALRRNYHAIVQTLQDTFNPECELLYQEQFTLRKKLAGEDINEYANELKVLGRKAFKMMADIEGEAFNTMLINKFISGLDDRELSRWLYMAEPKTLDLAVQMARRYNNFDALPSGCRKPRNVSVNAIQADDNDLLKRLVAGQNEMINELKHLNTRVTNLEQNQNKPRSFPNQPSSNRGYYDKQNGTYSRYPSSNPPMGAAPVHMISPQANLND